MEVKSWDLANVAVDAFAKLGDASSGLPITGDMMAPPWARSVSAASPRSCLASSGVGAKRSSACLPAAQRLVSRARHISWGAGPHSHIGSRAPCAR